MSSMFRGRPRRGTLAGGLTLVLVSTPIGVVPPAAAAPTAGPPISSVPQGSPEAMPQRSLGIDTMVTLITGDKVRYVEGPGGKNGAATLVSSPPGTRSVRGYNDPTGVYLIPDSAQQLLAAGVLDRELFDVQYLARNGYGDEKTGTTPVIVTYGSAGVQARSAAPSALPGSTTRVDLNSISGAGLSVDKAKTTEFWNSLTKTSAPGASARTLGSGVTKVWLDQKVYANLAESVPLVGAPEAWNAGFDGSGVKVAVLDTGYDAGHPDLQGQVAEAKSFIPGASSAADGHGHGTHVATTIAGTGAASGGRNKGVAPGADLMIGKVLNDNGSGENSWIIAGMEWAARNGARVVSMSLGGSPSDGTDPTSQAVNRLTAETGALFVIAAGNIGTPSSVSSPGAADAALTVAATDKADAMAGFSSRGPRMGDWALKPDIAAPGVAIVAGRAAGTTMGTPVDQYYTTASGTSMATPHVAGAAAILAQQHSGWNAGQLKPALISTSKDTGHSVYAQGGGRLDIARAVRQKVTTTTVNLDFGLVASDTQPRVDKEVAFHNSGDRPVTLTLSKKLLRANGEDASHGLTVPATVTVPAGGATTATFGLDTTVIGDGLHSGSVVAVDETTGTRLALAINALRRPPGRKVDLRFNPAQDTSFYGLIDCTFVKLRNEGGFEYHRAVVPAHIGEASHTAFIPEGEYHLTCVATMQGLGGAENQVFIDEPEVRVVADTTLAYNFATDLVAVNKVETPLPSEVVHNVAGSNYTLSTGLGVANFWYTTPGNAYGWRLMVLPSKAKPSIGNYRFWYEQILAAPEAATVVHGNRGAVRVYPQYVNDSESVHPGDLEFAQVKMAKFETDQRLGLAGYADVLAGKNVRGKLITWEINREHSWAHYCEALTKAADAGAAGVLSYTTTSTWRPQVMGCEQRIPLLFLDGGQWGKLARQIEDEDQPWVSIDAQLTSPYEYKLRPYFYDKVPSTFVERVRHEDLVRVDTEYHLQYAVDKHVPIVGETNFVISRDNGFASNVYHYFSGPAKRVEYYNVTGPDLMWSRQTNVRDVQDFLPSRTIGTEFAPFTRPETRTEKINQAPFVFGQQDLSGNTWEDWFTGFCVVCRQTDTLAVYEAAAVSAADPTVTTGFSERMEVSLSRDGVPLIPNPTNYVGYTEYNLPADAATYRLHTVAHNSFLDQRYGKRVTTDWTFTSQRPTVQTVKKPVWCTTEYTGRATGPCAWQPLIQLSHDFGLALDDTAEAGEVYRFGVTPRHVVPDAPKIAGLRTWVSYDDGRTWVAAQVRKDRDGTYQVAVKHPKLDRTAGAVSVRTEAWDSAGNRVVQTLDRAYGLASSRH